ncbi:Rieske 2Fe-2S domain-containing protein [Roseomonas chloroacetimidivorans]|uniref:Rieske 2Fe-2S domain-containing protein n=1 Tax=Roseomonas chloroacetimidivorans TaxID=1766656 RepID=UPI003C76BE11
MLSHEDNETLVRVGSGTAMGSLFRLYWIPFFLSRDLEKDGQPKRVKLLGEDLVAFRDTEGRVGLIANACAHRGAPMMFGRNEDCGIRCIYHGWKYDVTGAVTDMPAEPPRSRLKEKVRIKSYPCRERNGVCWTYMGPDAEPPPMPEMEWNLVPAENVHLSMRVQECNWLQALEGEIDSAHAPILHARIDNQGAINEWIAKRDLRPTFECMRQAFGMSIAAKRRMDEERLYWRVNQFVMPFYSLVPPQSKFPELSGHAWVPMDDENTLCLMFSYHPTEPLHPRTRQLFEEGHNGRETGHASRHAYDPKPPTTPYADYWTKFTPEKAYQFDFESQRTTWFSGLPGLWVQDGACQSGLSPIYDRTQENLCASDTGIVMTRRLLLEAAAALRDRGQRPVGVSDPETFMVRAVSMTLPEGTPWQDAGREPMRARLGAGFGYQL